MQIDLLRAKLKSLALHWRGAADKRLQSHSHDPGVKIHTGSLMVGGQHQMVQMSDHGQVSSLAWGKA
jgi:hypothetical protein